METTRLSPALEKVHLTSTTSQERQDIFRSFGRLNEPAARKEPTMSSMPSAIPLPYVKAPPPITLPPIPPGVVTAPPPQLRGYLPQKRELEVLPDVEDELRRFIDFAEVFGRTAPPKAAVEQSLAVAYAWSSLRAQLRAWLQYAHAQEAVAWVDARRVLGQLAPAYALAVKMDAAIGAEYPSLGRLFEVRGLIQKRAGAVRRANDAERAAGRPGYHGVVGKRRRAAAERAALAEEVAARRERGEE
jgi:hypothetical protein